MVNTNVKTAPMMSKIKPINTMPIITKNFKKQVYGKGIVLSRNNPAVIQEE